MRTRSNVNPSKRRRIANATMALSIAVWFSALGLAFVKFLSAGPHTPPALTARVFESPDLAAEATDLHSAHENFTARFQEGARFTEPRGIASVMTAGADQLLVDTSAGHRASSPESGTTDATGRWFNGRPLRKVGTIKMRVTAYSPDERSCGHFADGMTASGHSVWTNDMKLVAADTSLLPFGTILTIPGYNDGKPVPVLDRGSAIKGYRLDVLYPTHHVARQWGVRDLEVDVWEYADH